MLFCRRAFEGLFAWISSSFDQTLSKKPHYRCARAAFTSTENLVERVQVIAERSKKAGADAQVWTLTNVLPDVHEGACAPPELCTRDMTFS